MSDTDSTPERHKYFIYICPICGQQYQGPSGYFVAGDDMATSCFHGEHVQPKLRRVAVRIVEESEDKGGWAR